MSYFVVGAICMSVGFIVGITIMCLVAVAE